MDDLDNSSSDGSTEPNGDSNHTFGCAISPDDLDDEESVPACNADVTAEWSQFMSSTNGVQHYMEGVTAAIVDASALAAPLGRQQEHRPHRGIAMPLKDAADHHLLVRSSGTNLCSGSTAVSVCLGISPQVAPLTSPSADPTTVENALRPIVLSPFSPRGSYPEQPSPRITQWESVPEISDYGVAMGVGDRSAPSAVAVPVFISGHHASIAKEGETRVEKVAEIGDGGLISLVDCAEVAAAEPFTPQNASPCRILTCEKDAGTSTGQTSSAMVPDEMDANFQSVGEGCSSRSRVSQALGLGSPPSGPPPHGVVVDVVDTGGAKVVTSTPELPWGSRSFEIDDCPASIKDTKMAHKTEEGYNYLLQGQAIMTAGVCHAEALAFVGEEEVARRIEQEKARALKARRQQRTDNLER